MTLSRAQWKREQREHQPLNLWWLLLLFAILFGVAAVAMWYADKLDILF